MNIKKMKTTTKLHKDFMENWVIVKTRDADD